MDVAPAGAGKPVGEAQPRRAVVDDRYPVLYQPPVTLATLVEKMCRIREAVMDV
jgi:hypothetical protein